jgi:hypothetical protein
MLVRCLFGAGYEGLQSRPRSKWKAARRESANCLSSMYICTQLPPRFLTLSILLSLMPQRACWRRADQLHMQAYRRGTVLNWCIILFWRAEDKDHGDKCHVRLDITLLCIYVQAVINSRRLVARRKGPVASSDHALPYPT